MRSRSLRITVPKRIAAFRKRSTQKVMIVISILSSYSTTASGQMQDESAPVSLSLFFVVLLIRKDFS